MSEKHTPGPWTAEYNSFHEQWRVEHFDAANDREIVVCDIEEFRQTDGQQEACARLIAAAPELLTTLVRVLDAVDFERGTKGGAYEDEAETLLLNARAVIAKATGEA